MIGWGTNVGALLGPFTDQWAPTYLTFENWAHPLILKTFTSNFYLLNATIVKDNISGIYFDNSSCPKISLV